MEDEASKLRREIHLLIDALSDEKFQIFDRQVKLLAEPVAPTPVEETHQCDAES